MSNIIEAVDKRWEIKECLSKSWAMIAVGEAEIANAIEYRIVSEGTLHRGGASRVVLAHVVQINSDGSQCRPYVEAY